ncbi:MAG: UDP-N-acetylmuramoyl-L-alanyl-D-glutamate--2,6-diaminopimelate ligase, partial [Mycolicibacter algericus]
MEVIAVSAAMRPEVGTGTPLRVLADHVGAVSATGGVVPELPITGLTLRAQDAQPGDLFAALPGATTRG